MLGHVAPVADRPDDKACAPHDVAGGEDAVQAGHHRLVIDAQRAPASDGQVVRAEQLGQFLRVIAQRLDHQVRLQAVLAARVRLGRAAARCVGLAQAHLRHLDAGDMIRALERDRRGQPHELDAFLFGVGDLALRSGHIVAVAAIKALHRLRALPDGRAHAIHRRVAAADDDDILARRQQRSVRMLGHVIAKARLVGGGEIVERLHHARRADARRADVARLVDAGRDQDGVVPVTQLLHGRVAPDLETFVEDDAAVLQPLDAAHDDVLFQLEAGNAIGQQAAGAIVPVIDMHLMPRRAQIFGGGEAGRPRADHTNRLAGGAAGHQRLDPAFLPGGVGDEFFDAADGDGAMAGKFDNAIAFAQPILRADAAADFGHGAGQVRQLIGFAQPPLGGQAQPVGNMIVQRAMRRAIGHAALRAARRLLLGPVEDEAAADLQKIIRAVVGRSLVRIGLAQAHKFQHRIVGHHASPTSVSGRRIAEKPAESRGFCRLWQDS